MLLCRPLDKLRRLLALGHQIFGHFVISWPVLLENSGIFSQSFAKYASSKACLCAGICHDYSLFDIVEVDKEPDSQSP
jgi:hypothetical protein